ncbi:MAG: hypothetical protein SR1Q5_07520 [Quinella sp. 1Q5]|nr:hypothetical protein [Quinella sp. 1Q5]
MTRLTERLTRHAGKLSSIAQENLTGIRVVRAFGREQYERERFAAQNDFYTKTYMYHSGISTAFWTTGDLISATQVMVMTVLGAYFCVNGRISAGDYIVLASYTAMLTWPVRMLAQAVSCIIKVPKVADKNGESCISILEKNATGFLISSGAYIPS